MSSESTHFDLFPLPERIKLRKRKLAAKPYSDFVAVPIRGDQARVDPPQQFKLDWEDQQQGLKVLVQEDNNGHLIASVSCTDSGFLNKAAVSVALAGTHGGHPIRKTIPLDVTAVNGCGGAADFGLLTDVVRQLGVQLGVIVFLLL